MKEVSLPGPITANLAWSRKVYEELGPMKTGIEGNPEGMYRGEEVEYLQRATKRNITVLYVPDALVYHWVEPERVSSRFFAKAGRAYGHSRVQMKDAFGALNAIRSVGGYVYLTGRHGLQQVLAWGRGKTADQYYHSYAKNVGLGGLHGAFLRLRGK